MTVTDAQALSFTCSLLIRRRCSHTLLSTMFKARGFVLVDEKK